MIISADLQIIARDLYIYRLADADLVLQAFRHENLVILARYVEAKGQAYAMQCLRDQETLNEEELTIYKRGRNHKANTKAKNASIGDYRQATGFEALLGWLHLSGQSQRLEELIAQSLALIDQRGQ